MINQKRLLTKWNNLDLKIVKMTKEEITEVEKYFNQYSQGTLGKYFSHEMENFHIIIGDEGDVYQLNSDHEAQGIELETLESLRVRFRSFTGEELEAID